MKYDYYLSERIVNMAEHDQLAQNVFWTIDALRAEMEKESPSPERIDALSRQAHREALALKDFEIIIESRRVRMAEAQNQVSTKDLVNELSKREGVDMTIAEPYQDVQIQVNGPAIVLVVTD